MANVVAFHIHHHRLSSLSHLLLLLPCNTSNKRSYLCYLQLIQFKDQHFQHHKPFLLHQPNLFSSTHLSPALSILCRSRLWDSNAESYQEDDNDFDVEAEQWSLALQEYIDSIWILKVFGSYGWMLPVILISLLLASGLKAFLLALAIPILQSTFTFAFQRMQTERTNKSGPRRKKPYKSTKKATSPAYRSRTVTQEDEAIWNDNLRARKETRGYGSWVPSKENRTDLGGWDELDAGIMDANVRPSQRPSRLRDDPPKKSKASRKWGGNDTPMLLRLLISIFPFLEFME